MNTILVQEPTAQEEVEIRAKIDEALAELKRLNTEMAQEQKDIDRLKFETKELRAESHSLMEQTQKILAALEAS